MAESGSATSASASPGRPSTGPQKLSYVVTSAVGGAALGVPAGFLWVKVAGPPAAALTADGVYFGENQLNQQVGVTLWYLAVGAFVGLVAGLVVGWLGQRHGLTTVAAVVGCCAAAALVSYWTGVHVFGPDEKAQLAHAEVGDQITSGVSVDALVAPLGWPIGGLVGGLAAMFRWPQEQSWVAMPPASSSVIADKVQ